MAGGGGRGGPVQWRVGLLARQCMSPRATAWPRGGRKVVGRLGCAGTAELQREGGNGGRRLGVARGRRDSAWFL
jgi:hypothetical protein